MEPELEREKVYVNATLKALRITTNNIFRLARTYSKRRNIPENIPENLLDTISEVTIIEKDTSDDTSGGDVSSEHVGGEKDDDSYNYYEGTEVLDEKPQTLFKKCVFCLDVGHWAKNCELIPVEYDQHCFRCWRSGHHTSNCNYQSEVKPPWMTEDEFIIFKDYKRKEMEKNKF